MLSSDRLLVRWADEADLSAMVSVHRVCFPDENWREEDFTAFADKPGQIVRTITREDGTVIGSLLYRSTADEARIARVAVLPPYRRCGVAYHALATLVGPNSPNRKKFVTARVREHNLAAQLLLRKLKFEYVGKEVSFYKDVSVSVETGDGAAPLVLHQDAYHFRLEKADTGRRRHAVQEAGRPVLWP